jgi:hypothetical protein
MTPDEKRREAIAAAAMLLNNSDIQWHTIQNLPEPVVVACGRCGTPTTRAGLCSACANLEVAR